jgi:hypothetical protein
LKKYQCDKLYWKSFSGKEIDTRMRRTVSAGDIGELDEIWKIIGTIIEEKVVMICSHCGQDITLPTQTRYCGPDIHFAIPTIISVTTNL